MKSKETKRKIIFCEPCSYKEIIYGDDDLDGHSILPTSPVPGGSPILDPATKKTITKSSKKQMKKLKCPKCGRGVAVKNLPSAYVKAFKEVEDRERAKKEEEEKKKRIEDGMPPKREDPLP